MLELFTGISTTIVALWLGSMEIRMRNLDARLRDAPSRTEVSNEIEIRMEAVKMLQQEIKEDIREMKRHLERLADKK